MNRWNSLGRYMISNWKCQMPPKIWYCRYFHKRVVGYINFKVYLAACILGIKYFRKWSKYYLFFLPSRFDCSFTSSNFRQGDHLFLLASQMLSPHLLNNIRFLQALCTPFPFNLFLCCSSGLQQPQQTFEDPGHLAIQGFLVPLKKNTVFSFATNTAIVQSFSLLCSLTLYLIVKLYIFMVLNVTFGYRSTSWSD